MSNDLKIAQSIPREDIPTLMAVETIVPFGREAHEFKLLVPQGWRRRTPANAELSSEKLSPVCVFEGPQGSSVQVQAIRLLNEIAAGHLTQLIVGSMGWTLDDYHQKTPFVAHATADFKIEGAAFRARISMQIVDDVAYQVQCVSPAEGYLEVATRFDLATRSFDLAKPPEGSVEPRNDGSLALAAVPNAVARVRYPASWEPTPVEGERKAALDLVRVKDGVLLGLVRVKAVDKTLPEGFGDQLESALEEMRERGANIGDLKVNKDIETAPPFKAGALQVYQADLEGSPLEIWLMATDTEQLYLTVSMLSPSRDNTFGEWAINRRAFQIVTDFLKISE